MISSIQIARPIQYYTWSCTITLRIVWSLRGAEIPFYPSFHPSVPPSRPLLHTHIRSVEDLISIYVGPIFFRVGRLLVGVVATVHIFACIYWRVKVSCISMSIIVIIIMIEIMVIFISPFVVLHDTLSGAHATQKTPATSQISGSMLAPLHQPYSPYSRFVAFRYCCILMYYLGPAEQKNLVW